MVNNQHVDSENLGVITILFYFIKLTKLILS